MAWYTDQERDSKMVGAFKVSVVYEDDRQLSEAIDEQPVMIFCRDGRSNFEVLDQSKNSFPSYAILRAIDEGDSDTILSELLDSSSYNDCGKTQSGKIWATHEAWEKRCYFANQDKAIAALFRSEYGRELSDLKVEQFGRGDISETYYLCFWQSELDAYCGGKDCPSSRDSCQAILDGEVYGFIVSGPYDDEGGECEEFEDHIDSCWSFIGDESYCMDQGEESAKHLNTEYQEKQAQIMAEQIAESRPDLTPQYPV